MSQNLRRHFLVAAGVLIYRPSAALAQQQARRIPQIAWISVTKAAGMSVFFESFRQGLRDLGYIEGNNIIVNAYWADENPERLASLATEIVALRPDVIVANATPAIRAVQQVTTIIPIVMAPATDPVGSGFVTNLASPGGNITGVANLTIDISSKTIELLRTLLPKIKRIGLLRTANPTHPAQVKEIQDAAKVHNLTILPVLATSGEEIDKAFTLLTKAKPEALIVLVDPMLGSQRQRVANLAAEYKLPAVYQFREAVEVGGLMSYGPRYLELFRLAATYVDKILKGAKPAVIPVQQPTKFELVINRKTARALGLTIPSELLLRADEVIE